ncbi:uncharacterized protein LOC126832829 isoform X4 [Adelges cooleyi]|uniref:uncharacterized protein LOC126832829 isoform X3 n=1 Tax=Adelges cooleyi TaxID=133065 RepID=UPI0021806260|nr:uncharacterized protein LOC126832829 isoform X3 [Adelges cooleyi]XP_050419807.1 uncharacterized protein LOC126832829 isoform X4 [Adelges cooleyi]
MHFKIAVILCALYFITSAWSNGLSKAQIETAINMYKEYPDYAALKNYLLTLATDDTTKAGESKEGKVIDAGGVVFYIDLFQSFDVDGNGVISKEECSALVKMLTSRIKEKKLAVEIPENIVAALNDEINLAEFLKIIIAFEIDIE